MPRRASYVLCFVLFLLTGPRASSQVFPTLVGHLATDSERVDRTAVERAAEPLQSLGVDVLVLFTGNNVQDAAGAQAYFERALEAYGVRNGGRYPPNLFALFIGVQPLLGENGDPFIRAVYGERLAPILEQETAQDSFADTLEDALRPGLLGGDYTGAVRAALEALETELSEAGLEPGAALPPNAGAADMPRRRPWGLWWPVLFGLGLAGLLYLYRRPAYALYRTLLRSGERLSNARGVLASSRTVQRTVDGEVQTIKSQLADQLARLSGQDGRTGRDALLPPDFNEQADMVLLGGSFQEDYPERWAQLKKEYRRNVQTLAEVEKRFAALRSKEEKLSRQSPDLGSYLRDYSDLRETLVPVYGFVQELSALWQSLHEQTAALPTRLKRVRAGLEAARSLHREVQGQASDLDLLETRLGAAVAAHRAEKPVRALREIEALEAVLAEVTSALLGIKEVRADLATFRRQLERWYSSGISPDTAQAETQEVDDAVARTLDLLERGNYTALRAQVSAAGDALSALSGRTEAQVSLQRTIDSRLEDLKCSGEAVQEQLEQALQTFERARTLAPATWRDVRGNGSEAQKAARAAFDLWEQAKETNHLGHLPRVEQAASALSAAEAELARAGALIAATESRIEHLLAIQTSTHDHLAALRIELPGYHSQVAATQPPAAGQLGEAEQLVQSVLAELSEAAPDWSAALAKLQQADELVLKAAAGLDEPEVAPVQRRILAAKKLEANAAVARLVQFAHIHDAVMDDTIRARVQETEAELRRTEASLGTVGDAALTENTQRQDILAELEHVRQLADATFERAEELFAEAQTLRLETAEAVAQARNRFRAFEQFARSHGLSEQLRLSLESLGQALPTYDPQLDTAGLRELRERARTLGTDIKKMYDNVRSSTPTGPPRDPEPLQSSAARRDHTVAAARRRAQWGYHASLPAKKSSKHVSPRAQRGWGNADSVPEGW